MVAVDVFAADRPRLVGLAYRLVGSVADAEDLVQEAWLRCHDRVDVVEPRAFLTRVLVRLALDHLKSARVRRETYVGPWLPEPVATAGGLVSGASMSGHDVAYGLLVVLERLSPLERAAWVLAEVFDEKPAEIAAVLERSPEAVRQLLHRARAHIAAERPRHDVDDDAHTRLVATFFAAVAAGDVAAVERLLADDAMVTSDGGGRPGTATRPVRGVAAVARFLVGIAQRQAADVTLVPVTLNGALGVVGTVQRDGVVGADSAVMLEGDGERIARIFIVRYLPKLGAVLPLPPG
jgi:RNA polymerase sigma-70 factor (ECF subfamily)